MFAENLKEAMKAREMDAVQLAAALRPDVTVGERTVQRWMQGDTNPGTIEAYRKIARVLGTTVDALVSEPCVKS